MKNTSPNFAAIVNAASICKSEVQGRGRSIMQILAEDMDVHPTEDEVVDVLAALYAEEIHEDSLDDDDYFEWLASGESLFSPAKEREV